jgi:L-iditol 2-dehydrogenase
MRALVWHGPRSMTVEDVPEPSAAPGDVVVRVDAVGICGSELSGYLGESSLRRPPLVMGHEFCGRIERATPGGRLAVGERVAVNPIVACGRCRFCRSGRDNLCLERAIIGAHRPGGFAELVAVPERNCYRLDSGLRRTLGALVEPLACAVRGIEIARIRPGDGVVIFGAGTIGLCALAVVRLAGAGPRIVTDVNADRLETARAWGATHTPDAAENVVREVHALTGGMGADVAIDAVGVAATRQAATRAVRRGGRVVLIGLHEAESTFLINDVVRGEIQLLGSFAYRSTTFERALALLQGGLVEMGGRWLEERPLTAGPEAFEQLVAGGVPVSKIVLTPLA